MAESLAHRWGQIIGEVFEEFVLSILKEIAERHNLFLDHKHPRPVRAGQSKVTWQDCFGNKHDLDYVLERDGDDNKIGIPVAFIESAWRRYTKHSKNKVQEIEAAVLPVASTFSSIQPFCGAVLAGEFTQSARLQLESKGFVVLHIPYESILTAFFAIGVNAASVDGISGTTEVEFRKKIEKWESKRSSKTLQSLVRKLHSLHEHDITSFKGRLEDTLTRRLISIRLTVLRGSSVECPDVQSAIAYLVDQEKTLRLREEGEQRIAYEIQVRFNNGSKIEATYMTRHEALNFLKSFETPKK